MSIYASHALLPNGWTSDVRLGVAHGRIADIATDSAPAPGDVRVDVLLPAVANLHSHAFQRAMAAMAETRLGADDSFWGWRDVMYRLVDRLTPDDLEAIAAMAYVEMLESGFAAVGEFHYLHHQPGGQPYDDLAETSRRVFAAAEATGIGLTLLPVLYGYGDVDRSRLTESQQRFANDFDRYARLIEHCESGLRALDADSVLGVAPHSLRAVAGDDLGRAASLRPDAPVHIHIAEQQREVAAVVAHYGAPPVAWLLDNIDVDERWCLVHATHMSPDETVALARSGAVTGLCPVTEANLGDGIFDGARFVDADGSFGIGTDSNIRISMIDELCMLEYSQRLRDERRSVLSKPGASTGAFLYSEAAAGGAKALGRAAGRIEAGRWADLVAVDTAAPAFAALHRDQWLDGLCFAADERVITDVWSAGRHVVNDGRHVLRDRVAATFRATMQRLAALR